MNSFALFVFNIFLNSILAFFTALFLVEGVIFLFRIRQGRLAAFLRMIPILKLPLDLFFYDFSRWSYMHGVNPLICEEGSRTLSVAIGYCGSVPSSWFLSPVISMIKLTVLENMTFTLADVVCHFINPYFLSGFALLLITCSLSLIVRKMVIYYRLGAFLKSLSKTQTKREIRNVHLKKALGKNRFQVMISPLLKGSPFVAGLTSSTIYMPSIIAQTLTGKEYEAVLAHEIEHIRNRDAWARLILHLIRSGFWWIPMRWLQRRIEEGQEVSCDLRCKRYEVDPVDLASAICQSAKDSLHASKHAMAHHLTKYTVQRRVQALLHPTIPRFQKLRLVFSYVAVIVAFFVVFLGRFWIF